MPSLASKCFTERGETFFTHLSTRSWWYLEPCLKHINQKLWAKKGLFGQNGYFEAFLAIKVPRGHKPNTKIDE